MVSDALLEERAPGMTQRNWRESLRPPPTTMTLGAMAVVVMYTRKGEERENGGIKREEVGEKVA